MGASESIKRSEVNGGVISLATEKFKQMETEIEELKKKVMTLENNFVKISSDNYNMKLQLNALNEKVVRLDKHDVHFINVMRDSITLELQERLKLIEDRLQGHGKELNSQSHMKDFLDHDKSLGLMANGHTTSNVVSSSESFLSIDLCGEPTNLMDTGCVSKSIHQVRDIYDVGNKTEDLNDEHMPLTMPMEGVSRIIAMNSPIDSSVHVTASAETIQLSGQTQNLVVKGKEELESAEEVRILLKSLRDNSMLEDKFMELLHDDTLLRSVIMEIHFNKNTAAYAKLKSEFMLVQISAEINGLVTGSQLCASQCIHLLDALEDLEITPVMLLKHPHVVYSIDRLRTIVDPIEKNDLKSDVKFVNFTSEACFLKFTKLFPNCQVTSQEDFMSFFKKQAEWFRKMVTDWDVMDVVMLTDLSTITS